MRSDKLLHSLTTFIVVGSAKSYSSWSFALLSPLLGAVASAAIFDTYLLNVIVLKKESSVWGLSNLLY